MHEAALNVATLIVELLEVYDSDPALKECMAARTPEQAREERARDLALMLERFAADGLIAFPSSENKN